MVTFTKPPKHHRASYRVSADLSGIHVEFLDGNFFDNTVVDKKGTTVLDYNIAQVTQEVRAALYYLGTDGTAH